MYYVYISDFLSLLHAEYLCQSTILHLFQSPISIFVSIKPFQSYSQPLHTLSSKGGPRKLVTLHFLLLKNINQICKSIKPKINKNAVEKLIKPFVEFMETEIMRVITRIRLITHYNPTIDPNPIGVNVDVVWSR